MAKQEESLEQKAEELAAQFREDFLKKVEYYAASGAVEESDLDVAFLKVVMLLTIQDYDIKRFRKCKELLDNLEHF